MTFWSPHNHSSVSRREGLLLRTTKSEEKHNMTRVVSSVQNLSFIFHLFIYYFPVLISCCIIVIFKYSRFGSLHFVWVYFAYFTEYSEDAPCLTKI